jgi:hypothetical protein
MRRVGRRRHTHKKYKWRFGKDFFGISNNSFFKMLRFHSAQSIAKSHFFDFILSFMCAKQTAACQTNDNNLFEKVIRNSIVIEMPFMSNDNKNACFDECSSLILSSTFQIIKLNRVKVRVFFTPFQHLP